MRSSAKAADGSRWTIRLAAMSISSVIGVPQVAEALLAPRAGQREPRLHRAGGNLEQASDLVTGVLSRGREEERIAQLRGKRFDQVLQTRRAVGFYRHQLLIARAVRHL